MDTPVFVVLSFLSVSPNRSQFFQYESVSLRCAEEEEWSVFRNTTNGLLIEECVCLSDGSFYNITAIYVGDSGVYWFESKKGKRSDAFNITVTDGDVILESPVLPVTEGEAVTLRCRNKTTPSNLTADFYKDGSLIRTESTGWMTIPAVSKSDEGLYKCRHSDLGESPESWLAVRANQKFSAPLPLSLVAALYVSIVVVAVVMLLVVLFHYYGRQKMRGEAARVEDVTYADVCVSVKPRTKRERPVKKSDPIYSAVRTHTKPGSEDVTYGQIVILPKTEPQKKIDEPSPPEHDVVYSSLKPGHSAGR